MLDHENHLPSSISVAAMNQAAGLNQTAADVASLAASAPSVTAAVLQFFREFHALELILAVAIFITIRSLRQQRREGLSTWPVLGMMPSLLLALRGNVYEWITEVLHIQGGTFKFHGPWFSNLQCIVTADPLNLEHLLKERFPSFPKGSFFQEAVSDLLGGGIFAADGEQWRRQRGPASVFFHSTEFRSLTATSLVELVHRRLFPVLESCRDVAGASFDLQDVLLRLTFDNVCMIAFGADPGCLCPSLPEIPFARDFEEATTATIIRFITPTAIWKALRYIGLGSERTMKRSLNGIDSFAYSVINKRKQELASSDPVVAAKPDLLTVFMGMKDEEGKPHSDQFLRDVCVNFILAGRDTSSIALAWFFWLLHRHPEIERKVLEELAGLLKARKDWKLEGDAEVVFRPEEVKKMDYLHAALSESLRLYPSVPVDHKEAIEDEVFPDGTVLKKGTKILYTIYVMGRMESIWGPDCREFKPERWLSHEGRFVGESAYKFTAFNGGPRLCLGKEMAYYQMKFVAASVLLRYHVRVVDGHPIEPKLALTMYMKHGLKVTLEKRDDAKIAELIKGV